jgi:hypothetical protein
MFGCKWAIGKSGGTCLDAISANSMLEWREQGIDDTIFPVE